MALTGGDGGLRSSIWIEERRGGRGGIIPWRSLGRWEELTPRLTSGSLPDLCVQAPCIFSEEAFEYQLRSIPVGSLGSAEDAALG